MLLARISTLSPLSLSLFVLLTFCLLLIVALLLRPGVAPAAAGILPTQFGDLQLRVEQLERQACIDPVTLLPNARKLEQHALPQAAHNARLLDQPLTVAQFTLAGIAQLRAQNDELLLEAKLRGAARLITQTLCTRRCTDRSFRYRDGFVILLPGADQDRAKDILSNVIAHLRSASHLAQMGAIVLPVGESRAPLALLQRAGALMRQSQNSSAPQLVLKVME